MSKAITAPPRTWITYYMMGLLAMLSHPVNKNAFICFDLTQNPQVLLDLNVEQLRKRLYTKRIDLVANWV